MITNEIQEIVAATTIMVMERYTLPLYLTHVEVADRLHVTEKTIRNWAIAGKLKGSNATGNWLFLPEDVKEFMKQQNLNQ